MSGFNNDGKQFPNINEIIRHLHVDNETVEMKSEKCIDQHYKRTFFKLFTLFELFSPLQLIMRARTFPRNNITKKFD
jgi:hypothetical protein